MSKYITWQSADLPDIINKILMTNDKKLVVVGVIGKSAFPDCNKMAALNVLDQHPALIKHSPQEGQIQFYYNPSESILWLHFETTYDAHCMQKILLQETQEQKFDQFLTFRQRMRNKFARSLLFAIHICHVIVFVELNVTFDTSLIPIFKNLKIIRDIYVLKFLPKIIKNTSFGVLLGKNARLCTPRLLFLFENLPKKYEKSQESVSKLEFEVEDNIYKILRSEHIILNNNGMSLFSLPVNQRFVYYNLNEDLRADPIIKSVRMLEDLLKKPNGCFQDDDDLDELKPYKDFGKPISKVIVENSNTVRSFMESHNFMDLLKDHVNEALNTGFNDNLSTHKSKNHFVLLSAKSWFELFKFYHTIFIENPDKIEFETTDDDYKAYLDNFERVLNYDNKFFKACCEIGLHKAFAEYNNPSLLYYSAEVHNQMVEDAILLYRKYARGPLLPVKEQILKEKCETCWKTRKQQCEYPSLRRRPCVLPKHITNDVSEHSSGVVFVSTCNCGRTQGHRKDPYTLWQANYEFYLHMANQCNHCTKLKRIHFAIFEPSINDYRAAEFDRKRSVNTVQNLQTHSFQQEENYDHQSNSPRSMVSQNSHTNLSLSESMGNLNKIDNDEHDNVLNSSDESLNEFILKVKDKNETSDTADIATVNKPSTTEYLPGMVHTESPSGLLPQFSSWSLCCVGASSVYSHNTGLQEHFQTGFLPGSNFLLPWDVHVRLEHPSSWAGYEKNRYRKMGEVFVLKIFVGFEYECPRGHRFMMSSPDKILKGGSGISRDSGSKVVYNNMPLYYPCPCQTPKFDVAQLMRIHVVTPKAPVNVILDPKVRTSDQDYIFVLGFPVPPKLTQSEYWILRLPYIYQGDEEPILPPNEISANNALSYGCIMAGMFGVSEMELDES